MVIHFFKAPPEAEAPIAWPVPPEDGEEASLSLYVLDRAADPDGNAGGFDWYAAQGEESEIEAWADGQPLGPVTAGELPNPIACCPAELAEALPPQLPPPDYQAFWDSLLVSAVYQEIRNQALSNPGVLVACTEFVAAFADAKSGRPNVPAIQACINNLMEAGDFTAEHLTALAELLSASYLAHLFNLTSAS